MNPGVENSLRDLLALQPQCTAPVPDEILRSIRVIRERCSQAEKSESADGLSSWRRSHLKQGSNARDQPYSPYKWRGQGTQGGHGGHGGPRGRPAQQKQSSTTTSSHSQHSQQPPHTHSASGKYVSKFKQQDAPVEETILNQVILNKLNKFSEKNYDDVKSFLQQILDGDDTTFLKRFMNLVFQKAASEPTFCPLYARMIGELTSQYEQLRVELYRLYIEYLTIFEEVSETEASSRSYDQFVQQAKEKRYRLGYSQFLAELTTRHVIDIEHLKSLYSKILDQIEIYGKQDGHGQLVDEYSQCLLQMSQAFKNTRLAHLQPIRQGLWSLCKDPMNSFIDSSSNYPGIPKKVRFTFMNCRDCLTSA